MARRPVWINEVLGAYNGDYEPQYEFEGSKLRLLNEVTTDGTPHNADNMNNLFDFDNLDSMAGNVKTTSIAADGTITEEIRTEGVVTATRVTSFTSGGVVEQVIVYDDSGSFELRNTKTTTTFSTDSITEEVK